MSNAMKKLKLLHQLTASASHTPPVAAAAPQQFPTPPASPVSPQASPIRRHLYHPTAAHAHYTDVLRSARAALHTLHANQPSYTNTSHPPPPPPTMPANTATAGAISTTPTSTPTQCLLPGGFMVLTPTNSYENTPGLCVPASPPPQPMCRDVPRGNTTIYSSRPPAPCSSSSPKATYTAPPQRQRSRPRPRLRLTTEAVAKIGKDSRLARWERVLGYVREQRTSTLAAPDAANEGVAWASYAYSGTTQHSSTTPPGKMLDRKRRAEELATIEARNALLERIDLHDQDNRSLWSGGSGGTNGVDEFVWSEDEDDDILAMPVLPPPKKIIPDEEGIFEMQVDDATTAAAATIPAEGFMLPPTRTSTPSSKRPRPKSSPEEMAFQRSWGKRIVEEMPVLCREGELDGGLGRLVGRRMSAAY